MNGVAYVRNLLKDLKSTLNQNQKIRNLRQKAKMAKRRKISRNRKQNQHRRNLRLQVLASKVPNHMISGHLVCLEELAVGMYKWHSETLTDVGNKNWIVVNKIIISLILLLHCTHWLHLFSNVFVLRNFC